MLYTLLILKLPFLFSDDYSDYSDYFDYPKNTTPPAQYETPDAGGIPSYVWTIIYVIGGVIAAVLLLGLIILLVRLISHRRKKSQIRKRMAQDAALRDQAYAASTQKAGAVAVAPPMQTATYVPQAAAAGSAAVFSGAMVRHAAEEIPGETMAMLAERLREYLQSCGVAVSGKDAGKILAAYASDGGVRLSEVVRMNPERIAETARLLSVFFGASQPDATEPAGTFLPADDTVPEHMCTEIEVEPSGVQNGQPYCGIGADTFRGILRETEDEQFLPEEDWRLIDTLLSRCTGVWFSPAHNRMIRTMECTSSCMIATGTSSGEALDYAMYKALLPCIFQNGGPDAMRMTSNVFEELFRDREMPLCRRYFRAHSGMTA